MEEIDIPTCLNYKDEEGENIQNQKLWEMCNLEVLQTNIQKVICDATKVMAIY